MGPALEEVACLKAKAGLVVEAETARVANDVDVPMPARDDTIRLVVEAVVETLRAVVEAYGKVEAMDVDVET